MKAFQKNPVFWLMWAIPGFAVIAGTSMVAIAVQDADRALPAIYHWEGESLDADFERAKQAARLGLKAELSVDGGRCALTVSPAPASNEALQLRLVSGSEAGLDRAIPLARTEKPGRYAAACDPLARGRWRVALQDAANSWQLRGQMDDAQTRLLIVARDPEGQGT